ncbi:MAG: hypothetical protein HRU09_17830 [Oligoflexales bacterium]|nr:hypothetical protein [Oligoflexales bacterium]
MSNVHHLLVLFLGSMMVTSCGNKSYFSETETEEAAVETTPEVPQNSEDAQQEDDWGIEIEPVAGLEEPVESVEPQAEEADLEDTGDQLVMAPEVSLLINEMNADYQADINSEFLLTYTSKDVENCELSFEGAALASQDASQNIVASAQGTYSLTCYDAEGAAHSDARVLSFNPVNQAVAGAETVVSKPTDIIFAVDTSGSMSGEIPSLEQNLPAFIKAISDSFGNAVQIFMLAADDLDLDLSNLDDQGAKYYAQNLEVDSSNALGVVGSFVMQSEANGCTDNDTGCVRPSSEKSIVVLSDADADGDLFDDKDPGQSGFLGLVNGSNFLKDKVSINGFVGDPDLDDNDKGKNKNKNGCSIASLGVGYAYFARENPNTLGLLQDLCEEDYPTLLANLKESIISKYTASEFELDYAVDPNYPLTIKIAGGAELTPDQYTVEGKMLTLIEGIGPEEMLEIMYTPILEASE